MSSNFTPNLTVDSPLDEKLAALKERLTGLRTPVVAFSAGLDSTVLLFLCTQYCESVLAVTAESPTTPAAQKIQTHALAEQFGVELIVVQTCEMALPDYIANTADRCYICKQEIMRNVASAIERRGWDGPALDGGNYDDLSDYRPGMRAAEEAGILSPFVECKLKKSELREIARKHELPVAEKPSSPCLSTRIAYGLEITEERLTRIDLAERLLDEHGFTKRRVRCHPGELARIEVPADEIPRLMEPELRAEISQKLRQWGFEYVAVDMEGFQSGRMNQAIQ